MTRIQIQPDQIKYDKSHDILHVFFRPDLLSEDYEEFPGIVIRKSIRDTSTVTGLTIMDYSKFDVNSLENILPEFEFPKLLH